MNEIFKGRYFKRVFQPNNWLIVIALEEPHQHNTIECKVIFSSDKSYEQDEYTELFYYKLTLMTEEEVMLELL